MSVLDRVPAETRRATGWLLPMAVGVVIGVVLPDTAERSIGQSERLWSGGLALAGFGAGLLWQWYSPRDLAERLFYPACGMMALALILMVPGDWSSDSPVFGYWFPVGVVAGLVLMTSMQRGRERNED